MVQLILLCCRSLFQLFRGRGSLLVENLVLRQQLVVLKRPHPRPHFHAFDKVFWVAVHRLWPKWKQSLIVVTPETVLRWHRAGFRMYWTSFESPWQNGVAERWVASCRKDLLDHVISMNERHLKRLLSEYISYYHEDRTHLGLGKGTPLGRAPARVSGRIVCRERVGGLHHRYLRAA